MHIFETSFEANISLYIVSLLYTSLLPSFTDKPLLYKYILLSILLKHFLKLPPTINSGDIVLSLINVLNSSLFIFSNEA